eukprot:8862435-Alexandrium_andersonii.AAC.1
MDDRLEPLGWHFRPNGNASSSSSRLVPPVRCCPSGVNSLRLLRIRCVDCSTRSFSLRVEHLRTETRFELRVESASGACLLYTSPSPRD